MMFRIGGEIMDSKMRVYLAGSIEAEPDLGNGWRKDMTPFLEELGFEVLNPCMFEPQQLKGMQFNRLPEFFTDLYGNKIKPTHWHQLKNASERILYNRFLKYMRLIIKFDINVVRNNTDFVIVYWNESACKGAGTHAELTEAFLSNIPVYCVATVNMPAWAKACCTEIFLDFNGLREFLNIEFRGV